MAIPLPFLLCSVRANLVLALSTPITAHNSRIHWPESAVQCPHIVRCVSPLDFPGRLDCTLYRTAGGNNEYHQLRKSSTRHERGTIERPHDLVIQLFDGHCNTDYTENCSVFICLFHEMVYKIASQIQQYSVNLNTIVYYHLLYLHTMTSDPEVCMYFLGRFILMRLSVVDR